MLPEPEPKTLDVRPLLAKGVEPFGAIVEAKAQLRPKQVFALRAPFEPLPLYALFQNDGYQVDAVKHAEEDWEIIFTPGEQVTSNEHEIDLRDLEPGLHRQKATEAILALGRDERLVLHTDIKPIGILEQLENETTDYDCEEAGPDHWITTLWRIAR